MLNGQVYERLTSMEYKLLEHDKKFDEVFNRLQLEENIKKANNKILIIDNYIDDSVLKMLGKKKKYIVKNRLSYLYI
ncbi:MAG: hypothetical protein HFJ23_07300 [Clostridia bacterium]|nr:hypothetical protein [Clostridia bacterium]